MPGFQDAFAPATLHMVQDAVFKIILALVLSGAIGIERERHHRPAGIRTHMLLMMGVVIFAIGSMQFSASPDRIASNILTGVGFLGAGTIMRMGADIKGLTSAASIWATASIGLMVALGGGFQIVAIVATLLAIFVLSILNRLEYRYFDANRPRVLRVNVASQDNVSPVLSALTSAQVDLVSLKIVESETGVQLEIEVKGDSMKAMEAVSAVTGVNAANWTSV